MRLSDREATKAIRAKFERLMRTGYTIVYAEKGDTESVIKATGYWIDGEIYGRAPLAEDESSWFKREDTIYKALGSHSAIIGYRGIELLPDGEEAWAIRLERALHGNLRSYMEENEAPSMTLRIQVAIDLAMALQYVHDRGVIWGDLSPRNILVFDDLRIKLCDFAGSCLKDVYTELTFQYEPRYWVPGDEDGPHVKGTIPMELFALGTGICEITEWAIPYGNIEISEIYKKLSDGEYPHISEDNPVRDIIQKLWRFEFSSAQEVAESLKMVSGH